MGSLPLKGSFMITSIVGFIISVVFTFSGRFSGWFGAKIDPVTNQVLFDRGLAFGFVFTLIFVMMFIASVVSMTKAPLAAEESLDHPYRKRR